MSPNTKIDVLNAMISKLKKDKDRFGPDAHINIMLFPQSWIDLSAELTNHPVLMEQLAIDALFAECNFSTNVACIATYCNVAVDGDYSMEDIEKVFKILTNRLRAKRGMIDAIGADRIILPY